MTTAAPHGPWRRHLFVALLLVVSLPSTVDAIVALDFLDRVTSLLCLPLPFLSFCNLPWPSSPLLLTPQNVVPDVTHTTVLAAKQAITGRYAHFDVVAYSQEQVTGPFRTFIVSFGFTEFLLDESTGVLTERDSFCFSEFKANTPLESSVNDALTQAIVPRETAVDVTQNNSDGSWTLFRPPTPTLLGIVGDASMPLSSDPNDPNIEDTDGDGKPGVTTDLTLYGFLPVAIYIARREIFQFSAILQSDGSLRGYVVDDSEQLRVGSTLELLFGLMDPYDYPLQERDPGLNPVVLTPTTIATCDELKAQRASIFPPSPDF